MDLSEKDIQRELWKSQPSRSPRQVRKAKLKMRYGNNPDKLAHQIRRTNERLQLLVELMDERTS